MFALVISVIILVIIAIVIMWRRMNRIFALSNIKAYISNTYKPKMSDFGFDILYRFIIDFDNNFEYKRHTVYDKKYKIEYWIANDSYWFDVYGSNLNIIKFNTIDKRVLHKLFNDKLNKDVKISDEILNIIKSNYLYKNKLHENI